MQHETTRSLNVAKRRRRILETATALTNSGGGDFTVRELAAQAELTVPTLYNLIGGKEAIVSMLIEGSLDDLDKSLRQTDQVRGIARAEAVVDTGLAVFVADADTFRAVFKLLQEVEGSPGSETLRKLFIRAGRLQETAICEAREDGHLNNSLDATVLAHNILHAFLRATRLWAVGALSDKAASARARYALHLALLADATPLGRDIIISRLRVSETQLKESYQ